MKFNASSIVGAVAVAAAFWLVDAVLITLLDKERMTSLLLRNLGLALLLVIAFFFRTGSSFMFKIRRSAWWFVLSLWMGGAVANGVRTLLSAEETFSGAIMQVLFFPLTTLEVATYSGILPALLFGTAMPLLSRDEADRSTIKKP